MCTSILAGRMATTMSLILLARNEDASQSNWNKYLCFRKYPEYINSDGTGNSSVVNNGVWTLGNGLQVPLPTNAFSYSAMPDAEGFSEASYSIENRFYYEERGINSHNVAVSATNSLNINDKVKAVDPLVSVGISEAIIPTLILPQAESARHAVNLLGAYVEKYGASEGNGILLGDTNEAWYLEIGSGHHWIAVKVPDDSYLVVANSMRVHSVDLDSPDVLSSSGLFEFVSKHNLLEEPNRYRFNFAEAFGCLEPPESYYNVDRIWLAQKILTPSLVQEPRQEQYPLFLKPDNQISVKDVMSLLRATYKGTVLEGIATRPIGYVKTAESHIITLNDDMPAPLKGLIWQAVGTPLGAPYIPLFNVMDDIPANYDIGSNTYNPLSAYWSFRGLFSIADSSKYLSEIKAIWQAFENHSLEELKPLSRMLSEVYQINQGMAIELAKRYSTGLAYQSVGIANKERNILMNKITQDETA